MRLIVTLTSIPPRFGEIGPTLDSLRQQTAAIDEIRLYIPRHYRRFPDYDGHLPDIPAGVTIHRPENDLGPATKLLFAARDFRGQEDVQILFCDDDRIYPPEWAAELSALQAERPDEAVALSGWEVEQGSGAVPPGTRRQPRHRKRNRRWDWHYRLARIRQQWRLGTLRPTRRKPPRRLIDRAGYADVFQGFGGVVVRPDFFEEEDFDIPRVVWAADDVWLSGKLAHRGIPIWVPAGLHAPRTSNADDADALWRSVIDGATAREAATKGVRLLRERYGVWR
ncbi:glycosyltransferase family 2 protein [Aquicoccus sp. SCR17]|nr:glycosyltransferase family 2 protein [Carideicomes alvinocaridis]